MHCNTADFASKNLATTQIHNQLSKTQWHSLNRTKAKAYNFQNDTDSVWGLMSHWINHIRYWVEMKNNGQHKQCRGMKLQWYNKMHTLG